MRLNVFFLSIVLSAFLVSSCSDDSDPGQSSLPETSTGEDVVEDGTTTAGDGSTTAGEDTATTGTEDTATTGTEDTATTGVEDTLVPPSDTGETTASDADVPPLTPSCGEYCAAVMAACTDDLAQYVSEAECLTHCEAIGAWEAGTLEDTDTNTIGCRIYHAGVAALEDAEVHCSHAGPTGGNACGTWCDNYCDLSFGICQGGDVLFDDEDTCQTACATYSQEGTIGDATGNSVQCRIYHLGVAGTNPPSSAEIHCPHGAEDGGGQCVDAPSEPTCTDYCQAVQAACTGDNAQYADESACMNYCESYATLPVGTLADTAGNTIGCRTYHAGAAIDEPAAHCSHAGPTGGGVCGTACENYCDLSAVNCTEANLLFATAEDCAASCAAYPEDNAGALQSIGFVGVPGGDSVQCRLYHLAVAGSDPPDSGGVHCPHGAEDGGGVCVAPDPCAPNPCDTPDAAACGDDGLTLTTYDAAGTCEADADGAAVCSYPATETNCADTGEKCLDGACVEDVCNPSPCTEPPSNTWDGLQLSAYAAEGACAEDDAGAATCTYELTETDCGALGEQCVDGACVPDICNPNPCNASPLPVCLDGATLVTSSETGNCAADSEGVNPVCTYEASEIDCTVDGNKCEDGACVADVCNPNPCDTPPVAGCAADGTTQLVYDPAGTCGVDSAGAAECTYVPTETDCADTGQVCLDGTCAEPPPPTCEPVSALGCGSNLVEISNGDSGFTQQFDHYSCQLYSSDDYGPGLEMSYSLTGIPAGTIVTVSEVLSGDDGSSFGLDLFVIGDDGDGAGCQDEESNTCASAWDEVTFTSTGEEATYYVILDSWNGSNSDVVDLSVACCTPSCADGCGGDDGCGGTCGCAGDDTCKDGVCCTPSCGSGECGTDDGCGNTCECSDDSYCGADDLCVAKPTEPVADTCADAISINSAPAVITGYTGANSDSYQAPGNSCNEDVSSSGWGDGASDQIYAFTSALGGLHTISIQGEAGYDTVLYVVQDCEDVGASCLAGDDKSSGSLESVIVDLQPETVYYVIVDGYYASSAGLFELTIDTIPPTEPSCQSYCSLVMAACTDENAQYGTLSECIDYCTEQGIPFGDGGVEVEGNTVSCRSYHASVALQTEPEVHCAHAGPTGGDVCGSWCENYCFLATANCQGEDQIFTDEDECLSACANYPADEVPGTTFGDSVQCRLYHLGAPALGDPTTHCAHGAIDGGEVCSAPSIGEDCDEPFVVDALPFETTDSTLTAIPSVSSGCVDSFTGAASADHVYSVTMDSETTLIASVTGAADFDSILYLTSDCSGEDTSCLDHSDSTFSGGTESLEWTAVAGETYFVVVDGWNDNGNEAGDYSFSLVAKPSATVTCAYYCEQLTANCSADNAQYGDEAACLSFCEGQWVDGELGATDGNSLACRIYHGSDPAAGDPATHCGHAGPSGGGVCGNWCENYCDYTQKSCVDDSELYADTEACQAACINFPDTGAAGDISGDTVQCRIYHAGAPAQGDAESHCPHASVDGAGVCVDPEPVAGDTCEAPFLIGSLPFTDPSGSTTESTDSFNGGFTCDSGFGAVGEGSPDNAYQFTAVSDGEIEVALNADFDSSVYALSPCDDNDSCAYFADNLFSAGVETFTFPVEAGTTYTIIADGWGGSASGNYELSVKEVVVEEPELTCAYYCALMESNCSGEDAQYPSTAVCLSLCESQWADGSLEDSAGNTLGCRIYHGGAPAQADPGFHCGHAGPSGGGVCGEWCDNYCTFTQGNCQGEDSLYTDTGACLEACSSFGADGTAGDTDGDTVQCRIYHASFPAQADPGLHCSHAAVDGGGVCVGAEPIAGDTCETAFQVASLPYTADGDTTGASDTFNGGDICYAWGSSIGDGAPDHAYTFTAEADGDVEVILNASFDSAIYVQASCGDNGSCEDFADDVIGDNPPEYLMFSVTSGSTYTVIVGGWGGGEAGPYTVSITPVGGTDEPSCENYCDVVMQNCGGAANSQYESLDDCLAYCSTWAQIPLGTVDDTSGNTVGCRTYHADVAGGGIEDAGIHCPHAGPSGSNVCGSWCENYCDLAQNNCTGENSLYSSDEECLSACAGFNDQGQPGSTFGDSVQCRIYHLGVAGSDGATSAGIHCPHGSIDGGGICGDGGPQPTSINLSGWRLNQKNSTKNITIPDGTMVSVGNYVVVGRDANKAGFEAFWGVTLGDNVVYLNAAGGFPAINGDEVYTLFDATNNAVDGPSIGILKSKSYQRNQPVGPAVQDTSWTNGNTSTATPGGGQQPGPDGIFISEISDATGTGNFKFEFVEIFIASSMNGPPPTGATFDTVYGIFTAKCGTCHTTQSNGGHQIGTTPIQAAYIESQNPSFSAGTTTKGDASLARILNGSMPQGKGCTGNPAQDANNPSCLTAEEIGAIQAWVDGGQLPCVECGPGGPGDPGGTPPN